MEEKTLNITEETLKNLSIEELADLKVEIDDLLETVNNLIKKCEETLNN